MGLLDDPPPLAWTHPDAGILVERLTALLTDRAQIFTLATLSGINENDFNSGKPMTDQWQRLLEVAAMKGRLRPFIKRVSEVVPAEPLFERLLEEARTDLTVVRLDPQELYETPRLWKTDPMIDRAELRDHVRSMADPDGHRALLVIGDRGSGKSHTRRFITYLSERGQLPPVLPIDLSRRAGTPMDVKELAQRIASTLHGDEAPKFDQTAQAESVVTQFLGWLGNVATTLQAPRWLVFDGFTSETATGPAIQLVHDVASAAAERELGLLRVAVLGFDGATAVFDGAVCEPLRHPTADEVKAFFARMSKTLKGIESDAAAIDALFDDFVAKGGPIETRPLRELGPSALARALTVYGGAG